ncbi:enoyl-CoA hydratase/isomerase family protein [Planococcus glaciei]|uniref:enoyl-CoA hydratase/isomerase family protein n=1 Tax=Planococcus glaciei TaxID=459472 RepID=UPI001C72F065|nr:enoyl-CoA hydratase/isomerase family protein [Planococcus glaciei]MBX0315424.1 enoyl-CoA hydratase/isomerase family protein [Planococcus glaciei]
MEPCIKYEQQNNVGIVELSNPKELNAMTTGMRKQFLELLQTLEQDAEVKVIIVKGENGNFCTGSSVSGMGSRTAIETFDHMDLFASLILKIHHMKKIVISMVEGYSVGAGFSLALAADMVYASPDAKFGLAFNKLALIPDCGLNYFLPERVGPYKAKEWILSAAMIKAEEANENRLINGIFPKDELYATVLEKAESLAAGPYYTNIMTKEMINKSGNRTLEETLEAERFAQTILQQTDDHKEGINAFRNKQKPVFTGK